MKPIQRLLLMVLALVVFAHGGAQPPSVAPEDAVAVAEQALDLASQMQADTTELANRPIPGVDLVSWGASYLAFGAAMTLLTQLIKIRLKKRLEKVSAFVTHGITVLVSLGFAALIHYQGYLTDPLFVNLQEPLNWVLYGLLGGALATGLYDLLAPALKPGSTTVSLLPELLHPNKPDRAPVYVNKEDAALLKNVTEGLDTGLETLSSFHPIGQVFYQLGGKEILELAKTSLERPLTAQEEERLLLLTQQARADKYRAKAQGQVTVAPGAKDE